MKFLLFVFPLAIAAMSPALTGAQQLQPAALAHRSAAPTLIPRSGTETAAQPPADTTLHNNYTAGRFFSSLGGVLIGGFAGAVLAGNAASHGVRYTDCGDDPGLCEAVVGLILGSAFGGAALGAAPKFDNLCQFNKRFGYGLLGAGAGAVATILIFKAGGDRLDASAPLIYPVALATGTTIAVNGCRESSKTP